MVIEMNRKPELTVVKQGIERPTYISTDSKDVDEIIYDLRAQNETLESLVDGLGGLNDEQIEQRQYICREFFRVGKDIDELVCLVLKHYELTERMNIFERFEY